MVIAFKDVSRNRMHARTVPNRNLFFVLRPFPNHYFDDHFLPLACMMSEDKVPPFRREEGTPPPSPMQVEEPSPNVNGYSRKRPSSAASKRAEKRPRQSYDTPKGVLKVLWRKSEIRRKALAKEVSGYWLQFAHDL